MSESNAGAAGLAQPWTLRGLLSRPIRVRAAVDDAGTRVTLGALLGSRLLVWLGAMGAIAIFGRTNVEFHALDPLSLSAPFRAHWLNLAFAPTARWDSVWYLAIAHHGYYSRASSGFFPLYPLLIHLGAGVLGSELVAGALISLVSLTIAVFLLYQLARLEMNDHAARITVLMVTFFPTAFFFSAVYTESLFLMLSVGAIYAARHDRWSLAALVAGLAAASRVNGILLAVPLVVMYLYGPRPSVAPREQTAWWRPNYRILPSAAWLLVIPLGLVAYLAYLWITHDAALAPFQVQKIWGHHFVGPFGAVVTLAAKLPSDLHRVLTGQVIPIGPGDPVGWNAHDLIDLGFLVFALVGLALSRRRVSAGLFAYGLVSLALALSEPTSNEPLISFPRYMLVIFPLFMGWGGWLAERTAARRAALTSLAALLVVFSGLWGIWAWVA